MIRMNIILLGCEKSKRTEYFFKAAKSTGVNLTFVPYPAYENLERFDFSIFANHIVKIDPPMLEQAEICRLNESIELYLAFWKQFKGLYNVRLLNSIDAIMQTLDKRACKRVLLNAGLSVSRSLPDVATLADLREMLFAMRVFGVFIKPRWGSGASGVIAYRINPRSGQEVIYTSAWLKDSRLYNTNILRKISDVTKIEEIVNGILSLDAIVEEWIPKAVYKGKAFDLRCVFQFDKLVYTIARQSYGPITNLHLNNSPLKMAELSLPKETLMEIDELCRCSIHMFPGLNICGIDILLHKHTLKPYIIELNAQGDLIYQNIFDNNSIYTEQVRYMMNLGIQKK